MHQGTQATCRKALTGAAVLWPLGSNPRPFGITLHHSAALYRCTQTKLPGAGGILVQLR
jgi:hypothetical protein